MTEIEPPRRGISPRTRIAVVLVVAATALGGAFLLFRGGSDEAGDVAAGGNQTSTTSVAQGSGGVGSGVSEDPCAMEDVADLSGSPYQITVDPDPDPPTAQGTTFEIVVSRDGQPVAGATVCLSADMDEMSHGGTNREADEVGPGVYRVPMNFGMRGSWGGDVLVLEPGQTAVSMPLSFDVR